jgi:hypothetical protein
MADRAKSRRLAAAVIAGALAAGFSIVAADPVEAHKKHHKHHWNHGWNDAPPGFYFGAPRVYVPPPVYYGYAPPPGFYVPRAHVPPRVYFGPQRYRPPVSLGFHFRFHD